MSRNSKKNTKSIFEYLKFIMKYWISSKNKKLLIFSLFLILLFLIIIGNCDYNSVFSMLQALYLIKGNILLISTKICLFLFWFTLSIYSYIHLLPQILKNKINKLNFVELFVIVFTLFMVLYLFEDILYSYFPSIHLDYSIFNHLDSVKDGSNSTSNLVSPTPNSGQGTGYWESDKIANSAIISAGIAGGFQLAQKVPSVAGKIACVTGGLMVGAGGAILNTCSDDIANSLKPNNIIASNDIYNILVNVFNLTGNSALDLLKIILYFQKLEFTFLILALYNILLSHIDEIRLEKFLVKFLTIQIVKWYIKSIVIFKKTSLIVLICLIILTLVSNYYSYYYLNFFLENLEEILNIYFKK